jgi:hypothetical protein
MAVRVRRTSERVRDSYALFNLAFMERCFRQPFRIQSVTRAKYDPSGMFSLPH